MKNLFTIKFAGRMRRAEYWSKSILLSLLSSTLLFLGLALSENNGQFVIIYILTQLSLGLVMLGMTARRLHDVGFSGWMQLWSILPSIIAFIVHKPGIAIPAGIFSFLGGTLVFVLLLLNSKPGENKYGPNPKENVRGCTNADVVKLYLLAAAQGDAMAQYNLGVCYYYGNGVKITPTEAAKWFRLAAEQGHAKAQHSLGWCYAHGNGVDKDYTEAVKWYRLAAEQGNATAQNKLGMCYYNGEGVDKDYTEAIKWYRRAADKGNTNAMYRLGKCYLDGIGVNKDETQAKQWLRKAADAGYTLAKALLRQLGGKSLT